MLLCHVHMTEDEVIKNIDVNSLLKFLFLIYLSLSKVSWIVLPWREKSHLKKGDKPKKNTEGNSIISHGLKRFSAFSLLSFLPVFICFKKDIRLRKEKQETQKENKITWSNVRSITQSLPVEEFFSCFFSVYAEGFCWFRVPWIIPRTFTFSKDPLSTPNSSPGAPKGS